MIKDNSFLWGVATASYQVEGAVDAGGRGKSIWDTFCKTPGKVYANHNGDVACDQYHRYPEDIALMADIGVQAYRFSIAWPRILPTGSGAANQKGLDYYRRLAEGLRGRGVRPVATLYHWDLPQTLQDTGGGWVNRDTALRFADYAEICARALGDVIDMWITLNEPWCVAVMGHLLGYHAPGHTDAQETATVVHHLNLAHGLGVSALRAHGGADVQIGTTLNLAVTRPATRREEDIEASDIANDDARMYLWPLFGKGYPQREIDMLGERGITLPVVDGDMEKIAQPIDFLGLNYYMEFAKGAVRPDAPKTPGQNTDAHESEIGTLMLDNMPQWEPVTDMGWHITPGGVLRHLRWIKAEIGDIPMYITENGLATQDTLGTDGRVHDPERIAFLRSHLRACRQAIDEGINLRGYFLWSLIDNFEWGFGYTKRFGIVYCDYTTLARYPKDSYYFYRDVIAGYVE